MDNIKKLAEENALHEQNENRLKQIGEDTILRHQIGSILEDLAEYYACDLSSKRKKLFIDDLLAMPSDIIEEASYRYRANRDNKTFPYPAELLDQVREEVKDFLCKTQPEKMIEKGFMYRRESEV